MSISPSTNRQITKSDHVRREEVRERLPRLLVHDADGRDLKVEERAGHAGDAVHDVHALVVLGHALRQVALEVGRAVLVRVDVAPVERVELRGDDLEEVLEHVLLLDGLL